MTTSHASAPTLIRATGADELSDAPGSVITLLADSDTTGSALTTNRAALQPGAAGAPPHFHTRATELLYVLGGRLQVLAGEDLHTLEAGEAISLPPELPHAFAPAEDCAAELLVVFSPGMDRFDYYRLLHRVHRGEADPAEIARSAERFDNHYVDSPVWREARARVGRS
ncbi:cupin domain-containing protein [Prauserella muralis]|uniref:Cupin n=1 Tax=Prauserella muralis TaxID=588067 RepID=A0A2V4APA1_9PSEU|nr:cupin domain-containing protein [Prauserella muralis]PXY22533.1 cupin [Prauserella muralis]TWE28217.1 quercetin dioxygenase-like cupin family protein [Prauserella muralis]